MSDSLSKSKEKNEEISNEKSDIDIQPTSSVYATFKRFNYLPWYAIAEFVDNSTQNYIDHKPELQEVFRVNGEECLNVRIQYDNDKNILIISDNANGMNIEELSRAVQLNRPPPNTSGRSEFGMGLKTAACWFGKTWSIETKRLGLKEKYSVSVNVQDCVDKEIKSVPISKKPANPSEHYSILKIMNLNKPLRTRTHQRIKDQLASMYRQDLRSGEIKIWYNSIPLKFYEPPILWEKQKDASIKKWKKDISFKVFSEAENKFLKVFGWIGVRNPGSQRDAGFVLLRRDRVIIGGPETGYKPLDIFGQGNTFKSQRLIGEIHLDEWPVSQSKDMFDWSGGLEDDFVAKLAEVSKEFMNKADDYRVKEPPTEKEMQDAAKNVEKMVSAKGFADAISNVLECHTNQNKMDESENTAIIEEKKNQEIIEELKSISKGPIIFNLNLKDKVWNFKLFWQAEVSDAQWMSVEYPEESEIRVYLNSAHQFFLPYLKNREMLELLQKFVISIALSEKLARATSSKGLIDPADFRDNMNIVLRYASELKEE